jgi:hypothetical protein
MFFFYHKLILDHPGNLILSLVTLLHDKVQCNLEKKLGKNTTAGIW